MATSSPARPAQTACSIMVVLGAIWLTGCSPQQADPAEPGTPSTATGNASEAGPESVLNGTYRAQHDRADLLRRGIERGDLPEYAGLHTMVLEDGRFVDSGDPATTLGPPCEGVYEVSGRTVGFELQVSCSGSFTATWSMEGDLLYLRDVESSSTAKDGVIFRAVWGTDPFVKIE